MPAITADEKLTALDIMRAGRFTHVGTSTVIEWATIQHKAWAFEFARKQGRNIGDPSDCPACNIEAANALRKAIGWPELVESVPEPMHVERMRICQGDGQAPKCPAYHTTTRSCGRLIIDGIKALNKPVKVDGRMIHPCGCEIDLKARFKGQTCPAGRWAQVA